MNRSMQALVRQALPYSPLIEPGEADGHLFVDVTGTSRLFGPPVDVAWRLRRQARAELGLAPGLGFGAQQACGQSRHPSGEA